MFKKLPAPENPARGDDARQAHVRMPGDCGKPRIGVCCFGSRRVALHDKIRDARLSSVVHMLRAIHSKSKDSVCVSTIMRMSLRSQHDVCHRASSMSRFPHSRMDVTYCALLLHSANSESRNSNHVQSPLLTRGELDPQPTISAELFAIGSAIKLPALSPLAQSSCLSRHV